MWTQIKGCHHHFCNLFLYLAKKELMQAVALPMLVRVYEKKYHGSLNPAAPRRSKTHVAL
jgi:hypothetical protein